MRDALETALETLRVAKAYDHTDLSIKEPVLRALVEELFFRRYHREPPT